MPQVDLTTFYPIVFWTLIIFVGGFLVLNVTGLFSFLNETKGSEKVTVENTYRSVPLALRLPTISA